MNQAALYLRSSKDRSDVSIASQRRQLHALAKAKNLVIVDEFTDAVESGSTENRPGFQSLLKAIKDRNRGWSTVLLLDTSRLSRRQYISHFFEHECEKKAVTIIYKSLPIEDPVSAMMLKAMLQAMDQWHSMISKQKGLAGMAENVKQGYRAGGSAPKGYQLDKIKTGAIRDGKPVTKSRLIPSNEAELVANILKARAKGIPRQRVHDMFSVTWSTNTTLSMEWNALTYAGHTVWNVHAERRDGKSVTGKKRRPRSEWQIKRDTHAPLITDNEAEALLAQLEAHKQPSQSRNTYLLTGLLFAEDGAKFHGDKGEFYRVGKSRRIKCSRIDEPILKQVIADLQSNTFISQITKHARRKISVKSTQNKIGALKRQIEAVSTKINKLMDLLTEAEDTAPYMARIQELNKERDQFETKLFDIEQVQAEVKDINEFEIKRALGKLAKDLERLDVEQVKDLLSTIILKINVLGVTPPKKETPTAEIYYKIGSRGVRLASPRGVGANPPMTGKTVLPLAG